MILVHVCENPLADNMAAVAASKGFYFPAEALEIAKADDYQETEWRLLELAKRMNPAIKVSVKVLENPLIGRSDLIEAEALASNSHLIIVGTASQYYKYIPSGLSCALELMGSSKIPVMAVNADQKFDLSNERLKVVISDDMKDSSLAVAVGAGKIAANLGKVDVYHVYINNVTLEDLGKSSSKTMKLLRSAASPDELFKLMIKDHEARLQNRVIGMTKLLEETFGQYHQEVITDKSVIEGLKCVINERAANMVFFGRHQTFHRKPFGIGRVPLFAMLTLNCPVIVLPTSEL
jgi:hypothetical protein